MGQLGIDGENAEWTEGEKEGSSSVNRKSADNFIGPRDRPSPAWGLVENRPALLRRRRSCGARRAGGGVFPWASCPGGPGVPKPAGPRAQRARGGPEGLDLSANF